MNKKFVSLLIGVLGVVLGSGAAIAQNNDSPVFVPVDLFACSFNEGKGPADLDAAAANWTEYMDETRQKGYAAWTLTKHYFGPDQDFDVIWMGAWKNGKVMGAGVDQYIKSGGEVATGFAEVVSCDTTANFASLRVVAPKSGKTPDDAVILFSDCSLKDGVRDEDVGAAMGKWGEALKGAGIDTGIYLWYPVFGGGDADFDFKMVSTHPNHTAFGEMYEAMGNGGLYRTNEALFGNLMTCDVNRAYNAKSRRKTQLR